MYLAPGSAAPGISALTSCAPTLGAAALKVRTDDASETLVTLSCPGWTASTISARVTSASRMSKTVVAGSAQNATASSVQVTDKASDSVSRFAGLLPEDMITADLAAVDMAATSTRRLLATASSPWSVNVRLPANYSAFCSANAGSCSDISEVKMQYYADNSAILCQKLPMMGPLDNNWT